MQTLKIGQLTCECYPAESNAVYYILSPMPLDSHHITSLSRLHGCNIAVIYGMDWDNDLTPWEAPGVEPGDSPFKGHAQQFLSTLMTETLPAIEKELQLTPNPERTLVGISLSGLFALWAWMQGDTFENIGCVSASFWYQGFATWIASRDIPQKSGCARRKGKILEQPMVPPRRNRHHGNRENPAGKGAVRHVPVNSRQPLLLGLPAPRQTFQRPRRNSLTDNVGNMFIYGYKQSSESNFQKFDSLLCFLDYYIRRNSLRV